MKLFPTRCQRGLLIIALLLTLALSACQPITRPAPSVAPGTAKPEEIPGMAAALQQVAERFEVDPTTITVVSTEAAEWPDACLGAPRADEMCAAVITPGMRVFFKVADQEYEYRLSADGLQQRLVP